jgi:protease-4
MNFFKSVLASVIGYVVGGLITSLFFFMMLGAFVGSLGKGSSSKDGAVKQHSILKIDLAGDFRESAKPSPFDFSSDVPFFAGLDRTGVYEFCKMLKDAKEDEKIDGILIKPIAAPEAGWASLVAIREALEDFKSSGKFIYAYAEVYSEKSYYIASVADSVLLYPEGGFEWNGLASTPMFLKGMLDKLEVEPKIFKVGTFKSATEPFDHTSMSDASRLQTQEFLNDMWSKFASDVAKSRKKELAALNLIADSMAIREPEHAVAQGLVDRLAYEDELYSILLAKTEGEKAKDLHFVTPAQYLRQPSQMMKEEEGDDDKRIALIFAEGNIVDGKASDGTIGSATLAATIRQAREDDKVKAVVMRVNSPGGSALASDVIWREVKKTKEAGKPFYVSMGDVAASGGYYISAFADKIYAEPNTITGSIGVLGVMLNTEKLMENKIGLSFDRVTTHQYADLGNPNRPMLKSEETIIQQGVDSVYKTFMTVVKEGRGFAKLSDVDSIAQGRVWSGEDAKAIKLVDEIGGLDDAIKAVAAKASLGEDYQVKVYGADKDPFEELFGSFMQSMSEGQAIAPELMEEIKMYREVKALINHNGVYAVMPFNYEVN